MRVPQRLAKSILAWCPCSYNLSLCSKRYWSNDKAVTISNTLVIQGIVRLHRSRIYSPKSLRTLLKTLSFSGSYGWSLLGISNNAGKAAVYVSTRWRILSAMCWLIRRIPISFLSDVNLLNASSIAALSVLLSTTRKFF